MFRLATFKGSTSPFCFANRLLVTLPRKLIATFTPLLRTRGEDYVRGGRVEVTSTSPSLVEARVRGTALYTVHIRAVAGGALELQCSCGYARDHGNCKHIWATLVTCDRAGTLPSTPDEAFLAAGRELREADEAAERARLAREAEERAAADRARADALLAAQQSLAAPRVAPPPDPRPWVQQIRAIRSLMPSGFDARGESGVFPSGKRIVYAIDAARSVTREHGLVVELGLQSQDKRTGAWGPTRQFRLTRAQWLAAPDATDREIAQLLLGSTMEFDADVSLRPAQRFLVAVDAVPITVRRMCETGRCVLRSQFSTSPDLTLSWDGDDAWVMRLAIATDPDGADHYALDGWLERDGHRLAFLEATLLTPEGVLVANARVGRVVDGGAHYLIRSLTGGALRGIPRSDAMDLLRELYALPQLPAVEVPPELEIETISHTPTGRVALRRRSSAPWSAAGFEAGISFNYGGTLIAEEAPSAGLVNIATGRVVRRDRHAERALTQRLEQAGFKREVDYPMAMPTWRIAEGRGMSAAVELVRDGWWVEFDGRPMHTAGPLSLHVSSGIDWFDVDASVAFGESSAQLPELLAALRRGEHTIRLRDNSLGILDGDWLEHTGLLAATGTVVDGHLRFAANQLGILDVLLSALPAPDIDAAFAHAREQLVHFDGVHAADPPPTFQGTLRDYQREGLGWLHFLRRFGFGGCLADDMGLGKTVQLLALLASRQVEQAGPSLVVVPRSLVFNWEQEAARFTPTLRLLVHQGPLRDRDPSQFREYDIVLTTYGTLRRDAAMLRGIEFDYVVLDEAQAVKNAGTASAKAARLVRARHRLAMSGTPIENSLRELWSLLDFLNPGMLGKASVFAAHLRQLDTLTPVTPDDVDADSGDDTIDDGAERTGTTATPRDTAALASPTDATGSVESDAEIPDAANTREASRALLSRAVRPYILRRTKAQVTPELPERLEQTLLVDLSPKERARYDELRDHYRTSLLGQIGADGIGKHRMHVLEALLRLRQAACHPGLLDPARRDEPSSKVDLLLSRVSEAVAESHKVLVFSQFTKLLGLVRDRMDSAGIAYAYLDGDTTDRQRVVSQFQDDPACAVFLISLKAGGVGLNLTAADYVYLLDPWWNPAVEAQAIDRAHRIGQTRRVFAARLIARDTVEEKVLALQDQKRDLADAIIRADSSVLSTLGREELELLFS
ncbi:MAG: DEAD/DEAH box helicase [Gemmatimonadaceae bacterium]|nr:DEAD/DEAH box helicase [Gemmatimonadaceae bacterium]